MRFSKTLHGSKRQASRKLTNYEIKKTTQFGSMKLSRGCIWYTWGTINVVLTPKGELVTCWKGDHPDQTPKILSKLPNLSLTTLS